MSKEKKPISFQYIGALLDKHVDLYKNYWNSTGGGPYMLIDMIKQSAAFIDATADVQSGRRPAAFLFPFLAAMIVQYVLFTHCTKTNELLKDNITERLRSLRSNITKIMKDLKDKMIKDAKNQQKEQLNKFNRGKKN